MENLRSALPEEWRARLKKVGFFITSSIERRFLVRIDRNDAKIIKFRHPNSLHNQLATAQESSDTLEVLREATHDLSTVSAESGNDDVDVVLRFGPELSGQDDSVD